MATLPETTEEDYSIKKRSMFSKVATFNYQNFLDTNAPLIYLWATRILTVLMAYGYFGPIGLILITWVLLSFMMPLRPFLALTCWVFVPVYGLLFCYVYFINLEDIWLFIDYLKGIQIEDTESH